MRVHFWIMIVLLVLVIFLHLLLISQYLDFGMHSDDWLSLIRYNTFQGNPLQKLLFFLKHPDIGHHAGSQVMYMGFLENSFGLNSLAFNLINISAKILLTLSLYPLIYLIFRKKLLAFLTVILYAMSYSTIGSFHDVIKGTEYLAAFFMILFLIAYYLVTRKMVLNIKMGFLLIFTFSLAILLAPPRLFPLVLLPFFIEIFLYTHYKYNFKFALQKLFLLYSPVVLLVLFDPSAVTSAFIAPVNNIQKIIQGNWFTLLTPISGIGYMILWDNHWISWLGLIKLDSFQDYLTTFIPRSLVLFGVITFSIALVFSIKIKRFLVSVLSLVLLLEIVIYFLATNHLSISVEQQLGFDFNALYSVYVGVFVTIIALCIYIDWLLTDKKNNLKLVVLMGVFFSLYFVFCNWLFAGYLLTYSPSHEYLTIPAIGASLLFAALITSTQEKFKKIKLAPLIILLIFIPIYSINSDKIFLLIASFVRDQDGTKQQEIQQKIRLKLEPRSGVNELVFFDWSKDKRNEAFYSEILYSSFPFWIHFNNGEVFENCTIQINDKKRLRGLVAKQQNKQGFVFEGVCIDKKSGQVFLMHNIFYELDNFYAFEVYDNNLIDVKEKILKEIDFNKLAN